MPLAHGGRRGRRLLPDRHRRPRSIRRYDASRGRLDTIAGDGTRASRATAGRTARAKFAGPFALARDARGDRLRQRLRQPARPGAESDPHTVTVATVTIAPGAIETIAGNGEISDIPGAAARRGPGARDVDGVPARRRGRRRRQRLLQRYRQCDGPSDLEHRTQGRHGRDVRGQGWPDDFHDIVYPGDHGDGGPARDMWLASPSAVTVGPDGDLYIAEWAYNRELDTRTRVVWRIDRRDRTAHRVAGNGGDPFGGDGGPALDAGTAGEHPEPRLRRCTPTCTSATSDCDPPRRRRTGDHQHVRRSRRGFIPTFNAGDEGRPGGRRDDRVRRPGWCGTTVSLTYADGDGAIVRRIDARGVLRGADPARRRHQAALRGGRSTPPTGCSSPSGRTAAIRRVDPDGSLATAVNLTDNAGTDSSGLALRRPQRRRQRRRIRRARGPLLHRRHADSRVLQVRAVPGPGGRLIRPSSPIREIARFAPPFEMVADHLVAHAREGLRRRADQRRA